MNAQVAAADDFGHLVHQLPEAVLVPASAQDVAATVRRTAGQGRRFAAQGRRHSVFGRAQARDGIVADMGRLRTIHAVQRDRVVVDAGATWREVVEATLPHGRTPPVLTDYFDLSVGGTLAVGGVGSATSRLGVVSDHVLELQVVTGRGEEVTCSPDRHPSLFDAVRAGLGQVGIITRATLRLVPAPTRVRRFLLSYPDLATMLATSGCWSRSTGSRACRGRCWLPRPAAGRSGSTSQRSAPGTRRTTPRCSPACPTTGQGAAEHAALPRLPHRFTALEQLLRGPTASGGSRIRGWPPSLVTPRSSRSAAASWPTCRRPTWARSVSSSSPRAESDVEVTMSKVVFDSEQDLVEHERAIATYSRRSEADGAGQLHGPDVVAPAPVASTVPGRCSTSS